MHKTYPLAAIALFGILVCNVVSADEPTASAPEPAASAAESAGEPMHFESPDAAAMALIDAARAQGSDELYAVLGPDLDQLVSGDPVADAADRQHFVELADQAADLEDETDHGAILVLGPDDWPFPVPLAKDEKGWYFDTRAGIEEILDRRIGRNELHAIAALRAFVDAQNEYAAADLDGNGVHDFADRVLSSDGKRDGLYWPTGADEPQSPMGPLVADAMAEGYAVSGDSDGPRPFHGYLFKLLESQGPDAPGGEKDYRRDGHLTDGFAMVAWPVSYGNSGIMTFQVNQRGIVYERDLGEDTDKVAPEITAYDPGEGWEPTTDE